MEQLSAQFSQAASLMLIGMLVVFAFLGLLVVVVQLLSRLAVIYPDKVETASAPKARAKKTNNNGQLQPALVAAISTAVARYRHNNIKV